MPIGDRAILDVVVRQLRGHGFTHLTVAVGYLAHLIRAVFGDGSAHGVQIDYHMEEDPLGTAGPLATVDGIDGTFLAMNGDILTTLDYTALCRAHVQADNALTVATHRRTVRSEYGVLHVDGGAGEMQSVTGFEEKPEIPYIVSMGVYVLEPRALEHIPRGRRFDVPDLVLALLAAGERVGSYLYEGYWLDIGRHDDYEQALADSERIIPQLLSAAGSDPLGPGALVKLEKRESKGSPKRSASRASTISSTPLGTFQRGS